MAMETSFFQNIKININTVNYYIDVFFPNVDESKFRF